MRQMVATVLRRLLPALQLWLWLSLVAAMAAAAAAVAVASTVQQLRHGGNRNRALFSECTAISSPVGNFYDPVHLVAPELILQDSH